MDQEEAAAKVHGPFLADLDVELLNLVLSFLPGWAAVRAGTASQTYLQLLGDDSSWCSRCVREFGVPAGMLSVGNMMSCWRQKYRQLLGVHRPGAGTWCYRSRSHGLGDRVAAPQLFVGHTGQKLFCYGGWTQTGPQTDLQWVALGDVCAGAMMDEQASSHEADEQASSHEADEQASSHEAAWRFTEAESQGRPADPAGVQTLTPLWFAKEGPSTEHVASVYAELVGRSGRPPQPARGNTSSGGGETAEEAALVVAFGGGGGGYRNEHNDWSVGVLHERQGSCPASITWGRPTGRGNTDMPGLPTRRCAHTATYVPPRLAGAGEFPEGVVIVFGGHTRNLTMSLGSTELLAVHDWSWRPGPEVQAPEDRHGHSASLVEVEGRGYLVIVGGGVGNILGGGGREIDDVSILDVAFMRWIGSLKLNHQSIVPGRHHTACGGVCGQIFLFGGGHRPSGKACRLDGPQCVQAALAGERAVELHEIPMPAPSGTEDSDDTARQPVIPRARKMHGAACLLPWAPLVVFFGGWEAGPHFDDLWVLGLGGRPGDLDQFSAPLSRGEEPHDDAFGEDYDDEEDDEFVTIRMQGENGEIRQMRLPSFVFANMIRSGMLQPRSSGVE